MFDLCGTWEALDSSELIVEVGILDTCAINSEKLFCLDLFSVLVEADTGDGRRAAAPEFPDMAQPHSNRQEVAKPLAMFGWGQKANYFFDTP